MYDHVRNSEDRVSRDEAHIYVYLLMQNLPGISVKLYVTNHLFMYMSCVNCIINMLRPGLQIRVGYCKLFFLFLNQNICCGYSKELSN